MVNKYYEELRLREREGKVRVRRYCINPAAVCVPGCLNGARERCVTSNTDNAMLNLSAETTETKAEIERNRKVIWETEELILFEVTQIIHKPIIFNFLFHSGLQLIIAFFC